MLLSWPRATPSAVLRRTLIRLRTQPIGPSKNLIVNAGAVSKADRPCIFGFTAPHLGGGGSVSTVVYD